MNSCWEGERYGFHPILQNTALQTHSGKGYVYNNEFCIELICLLIIWKGWKMNCENEKLVCEIYIVNSEFSWSNYLSYERNTIITQRQKMQQRIDINHNEREVRWRRMMEVNHIDMIVQPHMIVYERFNGFVKVTWHIETHLYG